MNKCTQGTLCYDEDMTNIFKGGGTQMSSNESFKRTLFSEAFTKNPYPAYSQLREEDPVSHVRLPNGQYAWFITRYDDALEALKNQSFIKDFTKLGDHKKDNKGSIFSENMLFADMPEHRRLRGLVSKAFTPQMIKGLRGRIQEITDGLLEATTGQDQMNLIDEFAFPLPIIVNYRHL